MSKRSGRQRAGGGKQRRLSVRSVRRESPDLRKFSQALIALSLEEAAAEAAAEAQVRAAAEASDATAAQPAEPTPEAKDD